MMHRSHPYVVPLEAGSYRLCTCWESADPPFCDELGGSQCRKAHDLTVTTPRTVAVCACGRTETKPFCDGRHGYEKAKARKP